MREQVPVILSGKGTQDVGGLGEVTEAQMHDLMRHAPCFISFGTAPAAFVMTQMEAWCAGCPTVIYDNGFGIAGEGLAIEAFKGVGEMVARVRMLLGSVDERVKAHMDSITNSLLFDVTTIGPRWVEFLAEVCA